MSGHRHSTSKLVPSFSSTSSTCSSDYHNVTKGSCAGLFFQLFDWNGRLQKKQRLRRKSLPAERPASPVSRVQNGEGTMMPGDQNLNVIDGCGPPINLHKHVAHKEQTSPDKKKKKRSPNVVAKLMGLETMPSPDFRREKWPAPGRHHQSPLQTPNYEERSLLSHSRIPSSRRSLLEMEKANMDHSSARWRSPCISQGPSSLRYHEDALLDTAHCDATVPKECAKAFPQSATAMQDCKTGCILSPSNTHNKLIFPAKSPLASKARACLFEAANRVLEPKSATRNNENKDGNAPKQLNLKSASSGISLQKTGSSCGSKQRNAGNCGSASSLHAPRNKRRALSFSAMDEIAKEASTMQQSDRGHGIHEDVMGSSKCFGKQQGGEYGKEENAKLCVRRQVQTCRQAGEGARTNVQNATPATAKREVRGPNAHKSRGTSLEHQGESQGASSSTSAMSSILSHDFASTSTSSMVKNTGISSSCKAKTHKKNKTIGNRDVAGMESSCRRNSESTRGVGSEGRISKSRSNSTNLGNRPDPKKSHSVKDLTVKSGCINPLNQTCKDDDSLAEALSENKQSPDDVLDVSILYEKDCSFSASAEITSDHLNTLNIVSDGRAAESGCEGSCVSSLEEMRDTASSSGYHSSLKRKQTVSYSGKSTATILQELLSALNPSAKPTEVHDDELSEITSRTIQTGECASMQEEHTKEECLDSSINSYAHYYSEEVGARSISNREDYLLGHCQNNQQHTGLELAMNHNTQERRHAQSSGCQTSKIKEECNQARSMSVPKVVMREEEYVKCIVENANLSPQDVMRPSGNKFMVDPALFEELETATTYVWALKGMPESETEGWYGSNKEWYENLARGHRKLVFDCVQEALNLDVGITQQPLNWNCTPQLECLQSQTHCHRVLKHLNNWKGVRCGMNVDDLVEKAMNTGTGKWDNFSNEVPGIVEQVEHTLINNMIDELVLDLSSSSQEVQDARSVKTMLERSERKALIWVGL